MAGPWADKRRKEGITISGGIFALIGELQVPEETENYVVFPFMLIMVQAIAQAHL